MDHPVRQRVWSPSTGTELTTTGLLSISTSSLYYEKWLKEEKLIDGIKRRQRKPELGAQTILKIA